jgi:DNA/RNA-binding domain of Phe-tRNA-synthetase-like protein
MNFYIDKPILEVAPRTRLAVVRLEGIEVGFGHAKLDEMRLRVVTRMRDEISSPGALSNVPQVAGIDQLLGHFEGAELRRQRTLTESVMRRLLEGGPLPVENNAIDLALLLGVYYKLPVFVNDERAITGDVGLVVGKAGRDLETAQGGAPIRSQGRFFLADEVGYFESISARGKRALVTERCTNMLVTALFPENVGDSIVRDFIRRAGNWFESLCGGEVVAEGMVGTAENESS